MGEITKNGERRAQGMEKQTPVGTVHGSTVWVAAALRSRGIVLPGCSTAGTQPGILNTYETNPGPPRPKQNPPAPENRRYSFAKTDLYFKRFPVELKALVVGSKTPSRAANSVHEPRGLEPRLLLPRTSLERKIALEHSAEGSRVSVKPVHPRQPSPGDGLT